MSDRQETPDILGDIMAGAADVAQEARGALVWVPLGRIYDNPFQPRQAYDDEDTLRLADNIWSLRADLPATLGLQQPPVARVIRWGADGDAIPVERAIYGDSQALRRRLLGDGHAAELLFGHRRLRAWRLLRERDNDAYAEFPIFLAYADDQAMWRHAVVENSQRKDINAIEEALSLRQAMDRFYLTQDAAGEPFGFARTTVANKLRLLNLPEPLKLELQAGRMTERHGRALMRLARAPHLLSQFTRMAMIGVSVAELEKQIDGLVYRCTPLPPAPRTGYKHAYESSWNGLTIRDEKDDPPVWPYDWTPTSTGVIRGACTGCEFRATFGGDAGARCTEVGATCYTAKNRQWEAEQRAAQAAAIKAAPAAQPSTGSGGEATSDKKGLSDVSQETPAAPASGISRLSASIAADRPVERSSDVTWFSTKSNYGDAPAALLDKGLCDIQRCGCMVVAFNQNAQKHHVRPDAEHAPNMCVGCTSRQRLANRRKELEVGDLQEHRKRVKAEQEMAASLVRQAFDGYSADELWHNRVIMLAIAEGTMQIEQRYKLKDADTGTLQWRIFDGCAAAKCMTWDGSSQKWSVDTVQEWLHQVAVAAGRVEPEIGMVATALAAQSPDPQPEPVEGGEWWHRWQDNWSDDDEDAYQDLIMDWDGRAWQSLAAKAIKLVHETPLGITPAVLHRLAQECPDVTLSAVFGRMAREWQAVAA